MGFLSFLDKAKDKLEGSAKQLGQAFALPVGFTLDLARQAPGTDFLDRGFLDNLSTTKSLSGAVDTLIGQNTLTGWGMTKAGEGLNTAYRYGIENPIEAAWYHADTQGGTDPVSWSQAWDLAKKRNIGQTAQLIANDSLDQLGDDLGIDARKLYRQPFIGGATMFGLAGVGAEDTKGIHSTDPDAWKEFQKHSAFWSGATASTVDITAQFAADPFVLASKVTAAPRLARRLRPVEDGEQDILSELMQQQKNGILGVPLKGEGLKPRTDKLIGTVEYESKMSSRGRELHDVNGDPLKTAIPGKPGWLDGKSEIEIYKGLELDKHAYGDEIATMLARTNKIDNPVDKVNIRRDVLATMGGDPNALKRLNETVPEYGYKFSNMMRGRGTGEIDAAIADDAAADAIAAGTELPKFAQPETVAAVAGEVESLPKYDTWLHGRITDRTLAVSAKADRTVARLRQQGIGRDGTMHTGYGAIDNTINRLIGGKAKSDGSIVDDALVNDPEMVGKQATEGLGSGAVNQPEQSIFLNGPNSMPVRFLRTRKVARFATEAVTGVKYVKGAAKLSDSLRGRVVYGTLNVEDEQLSIAVTHDMLRRAGVSPDRIDQYASAVVRADNPTARSVAVNRAQTAALRSIAERHGLDADTVEAIATAGGKQREGFVSSLKGQSYSASQRADGTRTDVVYLPDDGGTVVAPILNTQTPNSVDLLDLDYAEKWLKRDDFVRAYGVHSRHAREGGNELRKAVEATGLRSPIVSAMQAADAGLLRAATERTNTIWKAAVLLTRPVSYALRNSAEEQMRIAAIGQTGHAVEIAARQAAHDVRDLTRLTGEGVKHRPWAGPAYAQLSLHKQELEHLQELHTDPASLAEVQAIKSELRSLRGQKAGAARRGNADDVAELESAIKVMEAKPLYTEHAAWENEIKTLQQRIDSLQAEIKERSLPDSGTRSIAGLPGVEFPQAYEGIEGKTAYDLVSGGGTFDQNATEYGERGFARLRGVGQQDYMSVSGLDQPKDVVAAHMQGWTWILNKQIRQDAAAQVALAAKSERLNPDEMVARVKAYLDSAEGSKYRRANPVRSHDTDAWASDISDMVDHYVPDSETAAQLLERELTKGELKEAFPESIRPDVHGGAVDAVIGSQARKMEKFVGNSFRNIDKMSVQRMSRHPMFSLYFEESQERLAKVAARRVELERGPEGKLTVDEINGLTTAARKDAALKLKQTFYDTSSRSSAAHQLRFIYPFFAAHQDSMTFWGRAIAQNPAVLRKLQLSFQAPAGLGLVVDQEGNPVKPGTALANDHQLLLQMPKAWGGPDPKDPTSKGSGMRVSLSSFNLITQNGSILNPGAGPLVSIPAGYVAKKYGATDEDISKAMTWFNPFGAPKDNGIQSALPTSLQRFKTLWDAHHDQNSAEYTQMWAIRMTEAQVDFFKEHDRPPNSAESRLMEQDVSEKVKHMSLLRFGASIVSPVQPRPTSKMQGLIDEYHRLADRGRAEGQGPFWASDTFLDTYGDAYIALTKSDSENRAHLDPTHATVRSLEAHSKLLDQTTPEAWQVIVGGEGSTGKDGGAFSIDAYRWMQDKSTSTVGGEKLIDKKAQKEHFFDVNVAAGWREYNKRMDQLQALATQQGLTSPDQSPELKQLGQQVRAQLAEQFPQWASVKAGGGGTDFNSDLWPSLQKIAKTKSLLNDPARGDIRLLSQYVQGRQAILQVLQKRKTLGYSSDMKAQSNADLAYVYAHFVSALKESNTDFSNYTFPNVIERDPLYISDSLLEAPNG